MMLADYLRSERQLTGTKIVCAEGDCGACSVLRSTPPLKDYIAFNSCIMPVALLDGTNLVSVEALSENTRLNTIQKNMVECHASQCGFCTPGFVVALTGAIDARKNDKRRCKQLPCEKNSADHLSQAEAKNALTGNLCRCTGYQPIIEAATKVDLSSCEKLSHRFSKREILSALTQTLSQPVKIKTDRFEFFAPKSLSIAAKYLAKNRDAKILASATDLGVMHNKRRNRLNKCLSLHLIKDLGKISKLKGGRIQVGANVTLTQLREAMKVIEPELSRYLDIFASPQIKNVATLIGNVANASPIADLPVYLMIAEAEIHIEGPLRKRTIEIKDFFLSYRKTALVPGEIIHSISFQPTPRGERTALFKISERKDLDISNVNAGIRIRMKNLGGRRIVDKISIAFGGVGPTAIRPVKTELLFLKNELQAELIQQGIAQLQNEIMPVSDVRGSANYRRVLAENLLRRFLLSELNVDPSRELDRI